MQTWLAPYAVVQSEVVLQAPQVKLLQTCAVLLQRGAVWQSPMMQALPWQM